MNDIDPVSDPIAKVDARVTIHNLTFELNQRQARIESDQKRCAELKALIAALTGAVPASDTPLGKKNGGLTAVEMVEISARVLTHNGNKVFDHKMLVNTGGRVWPEQLDKLRTGSHRAVDKLIQLGVAQRVPGGFQIVGNRTILSDELRQHQAVPDQWRTGMDYVKIQRGRAPKD